MGYSKIWALHDARAHSPAFFLSPKRPRGSLRSPVLDLDPDARFSSVSFGFWIWAWGNSWPHHLKFLHFLLNMLCMMARYRSVGRRSRSMHERSTMVMSELVSWWASIVVVIIVVNRHHLVEVCFSHSTAMSCATFTASEETPERPLLVKPTE